MTIQEKRLFRQLMAQSFHPADWFTGNDRDEDAEYGDDIMWVYRRERGEWVVGFYSPDGEWHQDSSYGDQRSAVSRVHYLNGGK